MLGHDPAQGATRRCFFALWPDAALAQTLYEVGQLARQRCGGRLMRAGTLHVTLAFLGNIPVERVEHVKAIAGDLAAGPSFDLRIDHAGYWRQPRIYWAGPVSPRLTFLADALSTGLRDAGFALEPREYVPHLTLLRDARCDPVPVWPVALHWPVRDFVLVESRPSPLGANYEVVGRWPLSSPQVLK